MKRFKRIFWGAMMFLALGFGLVLATKGQSLFESHTDRRFALVNNAGAIVVIVYADDVELNEGSGATGFYRGGNLVAWMRGTSGLRTKEMFPIQMTGKDNK